MPTHPILQDLNPPQQEAVTTTEGPLLVLAGAGSGKTRVLTRRIAWILDQGKARRHNLLAVTFTNKAAREMAERVAHLCGPGRFPHLGTFHSVCCRWLRNHGERLGLAPQFAIYDTSEQLVVMKEVVREKNLDDKQFPPRGLLSRVSHLKNHLVDPGQALAAARNPFERDLADVYTRYEARLRENQALDFDDLLVLAVRLFHADPDLLADYRELLRYLLIDEYQDVNPVQYELLRLLAGERRNLCAVGDDDQSIYGFRGADLSILLRFEEDFPEARVVRLEQNYRSTQAILDAANALVRHNLGRKGKNLWSDKAGGVRPRVHGAADGREEALFIVRTAAALSRQGPHRLSDMVVLYRTNAQSRLLEEGLIQNGTPYNIVGGLRFYDRKEVKDVVAWLRLLQNPADSISLRRVLGLLKGVGDTSVQRVGALAHRTGLTLYEALGQAREAGAPAKAAGLMAGMKDWLDDLAAQVRRDDRVRVSELLVEVLTRSGYRVALQQEGTVEAQARLENLGELLNVTAEFDRNFEGDENPLEAFLAEVSLLSDQDTYEAEQDRLTLMTVHTAKGLEFPVVFLAGLEEETFPHVRSIEDEREGGGGGMEEERRLAYVGITRAREQLFLTWAQSREIRGLRLSRKLSRFVAEVPEELLDAPRGALTRRRLADDGPAIGSGRWQGWGRTARGPAPQPHVNTYRGEEAKRRIDPPRRELGTAGPVAERNAAVQARFPVGTPVHHKVFGRGSVLKVERDLLTVEFDGGKQRTLKDSFLTPTAPATAPAARQVGDRVRHERWGSGVVKSADASTVTVVFPGLTMNMSREEASRGQRGG